MLVAAAAALALAGAWLARRGLVEAGVARALRALGVETELHLETLERDRVSGSLTLGPKDAPTVVAPRFEARIAVAPLLGPNPLNVTLLGVTLQRPTIAATVDRAGRISFGQLDRLIARLSLTPATPGAAAPDIDFQDGTLRLATPAGSLVAHGAGLMRGGRLVSLDAVAEPTTMQIGARIAQVRAAALVMRSRGDTTVANVHVAVGSLTGPGEAVRGVDLLAQISGRLDLAALRAEGAHLHITASATEARRGDVGAQAASATADISALNADWRENRLSLQAGPGAVNATVGRVVVRGAALQGAALTTTISDLKAVADGSATSISVNNAGDLRAAAGQVTLLRSPMSFGGMAMRWRAEMGVGPSAPPMRLAVSAAARVTMSERAAAALTGDIPVGPFGGDATSLTPALRSVQFIAPAIGLSGHANSTQISLGAPASFAFAGGGRLLVASIGRTPVASLAGGGASGSFTVASSGARLPELALAVSRYHLGSAGFDGQIAGRAALSTRGARGLKLQSAGRLRLADGAVIYDAGACGPISAAHVDLGAVSLSDGAAQLCPTPGATTAQVSSQGWRAAARYSDLSGDATGLSARMAAGAGDFDLRGGAHLDGVVRVAGVDVTDTAAPHRYEPMHADGVFTLDPAIWSGRFNVATRGGHPIGTVTVRHDPTNSRGEAVLDVRQLTFAKGGLQPVDLSPLAASMAPAVGAVDFTGRVAWADGRTTSEGDFAADGLSLRSQLGTVSGLRTRIHLTSLAPIETAPGQVVTADRIAALAPLTDVRATFRLTKEALDLEAASATAEDGRLTLAATSMPFDPQVTSHGVLTLDAIDLGKLVATSSLADKVDLDAVVSGALPYQIGPEGLRFDGGRLAAIRPGRISIHRDALTTGPVTNAVQDMAFQALEALAFQELDATVQSRPLGRLGVIFHVKGRFEPKIPQEANIPIADLLSGKALKNRIPLPSNTPVNLNLDSSLNFDQLLADYRQAFDFHLGTVKEGAALHSDPVQR